MMMTIFLLLPFAFFFICNLFFFPKTVSSLRDPNQSGICTEPVDIAVALNYIYIRVDGNNDPPLGLA